MEGWVMMKSMVLLTVFLDIRQLLRELKGNGALS